MGAPQVMVTFRFLVVAAILATPGGVHPVVAELRLHGGSPPVVEYIPGTDGPGVFDMLLESDSVTVRQRGITPESRILLSPFQQPGVHQLTVTIARADDSVPSEQFSYTVAFTDFQWGRDNFRFANDSQYRGEVQSYSTLLLPWVTERFGGVDQIDEALLTVYAYRVLREQLGLCYAFAGAAVRYLRDPQALPRFSRSIYAIGEANRTVRQEMEFLQNDIVFELFARRGVPEQPMSRDEVEAELAVLQRSIDQGAPVVMGVLAPRRHHAMVAWAYVLDHASGEVTVVLANNWDRNEEDNISNSSTELVRYNPGEGSLRWINAPNEPYRELTHLLVHQVEPEYHHQREILDRLLHQLREELVERRRRIVLLEGIRSARFLDVDDHAGEDPPSLTRTNDNAIADVPAEGHWPLEVRRSDAETTITTLFAVNGEIRLLQETFSGPAEVLIVPE